MIRRLYLVAGLTLATALTGGLSAQPVTLYSTGFEASETPPFTLGNNQLAKGMYDPSANPTGTNWITAPTTSATDGTCNIVAAAGSTQAARLGLNPPNPTTSVVYVYPPINYDPVGQGTPVVQFSVDVTVTDSTDTSKRDAFGFRVFNMAGLNLGTIYFDNTTLNVRRGDGVNAGNIVGTFQRGTTYTLVATINFAANTWSATLSGTPLFTNAPFNASPSNPTLDLGDIDATWFITSYGTTPVPIAGTNYLTFDNYRITAAPYTAAPVFTTQPTPQSVSSGQPATFTVAASGAPAPTFQWQVSTDGGTTFTNDTADAGAATPSLTVSNPTVAMSGYLYRALANNSVQGNVASNAVALTVTKGSQTIAFAALPNRAFTTVPFGVAASASSGLPVSFAILSGPATINGSSVTLTGTGVVTIRASQAGNSDYFAAPAVDRSFTSTTNTTDLYFTDFESPPFTLGSNNLAGTDGWVSTNSSDGSSSIVAAAGSTQAARIGGVTTPLANSNVYVWRPINYDPIAQGTPVIQFSVDLNLTDSTNAHRDVFGFRIYNIAGVSLATLYLDNGSLHVFRGDGTANSPVSVGTFANGTTYTLVVTINFAANTWSATLGGTTLFNNQTFNGVPLNSTNPLPPTLNLGDIDPFWLIAAPATPGNNYLTFDNYRISTVVASNAPSFSTQPVSQSVASGQTATFTAAATGTPAPTFQWQRSTDGGTTFANDVVDGGATTGTLTVSSPLVAMNGYQYRVLASNSVQSNVVSNAATLTVAKSGQTINFAALPGRTFGAAPFTVAATASSGLPVSFAILSGPATISGSTVAIFGPGTVTIRASQAGGTEYNAAPTVDQSFAVTAATTDLYFTDFSSFPIGNIAGNDGWISSTADSAGSVVAGGIGRIGFNPTTAASVKVWRPLNYDPVAQGTPSIQFSVDLSLVDSTNGHRDLFGFLVFNTAGQRLGGLLLDPASQHIFRYDGTTTQDLGAITFGSTYTLAATLNFATNQWSAVLGGVLLFSNQPITASSLPLTLGDIDAYWQITTPGTPGNNYLTFDNFRVSAITTGSPPIFLSQPQSQNVPSGQAATFTVAVSGTPLPAVQWQRSTDGGATWVNDTTDSGVTTPNLTVTSPVVAMSGYQYRALASNATQANVASNAVALTVTTVSQTITFGALADHTYGTTPIALVATSTSGLPVSFSVVSGPATVNGSTLTLTGWGAVTVRASQTGTTEYNAAPTVDRTFNSVTTGVDLYFTDFESFTVGNDQLAGTDGWLTTNGTPGTSGIKLSAANSKVGFVGQASTTAASTFVGRPINYDPVAAGTPALQFTVDVSVVDSTNGQRDTFGFVLVNAAGLPLAAIYLDNTTQAIFRYDGVNTVNTGVGFARGTTYTLAVAMNFATNTWSAIINGTVLFGGAPINMNVPTRALTLGDIDPAWIVSNPGSPGDNYLTFDNFHISTYAPPIFTTQPAAQSVAVGQAATFTVVASGTPAPSLLWQVSTDGGVTFNNDTADTGVTSAMLTVGNVTSAMSGYQYRCLGSNIDQSNVASNPATLTVQATFASWQQSKFTAGELANPAISGPNAVYGLDGLSNLVKYALGLEPKMDVISGLPYVSSTATDWVYTYTRPSNRSDLTYSVEVSPNLLAWSSAPVTLEFVSTAGGIDTWHGRVPLSTGTNIYFRLKVTH